MIKGGGAQHTVEDTVDDEEGEALEATLKAKDEQIKELYVFVA